MSEMAQNVPVQKILPEVEVRVENRHLEEASNGVE